MFIRQFWRIWSIVGHRFTCKVNGEACWWGSCITSEADLNPENTLLPHIYPRLVWTRCLTHTRKSVHHFMWCILCIRASWAVLRPLLQLKILKFGISLHGINQTGARWCDVSDTVTDMESQDPQDMEEILIITPSYMTPVFSMHRQELLNK